MTSARDNSRKTGGSTRRTILWVTILSMALFVALSIFGAFIGAGRAARFFSSIPLVTFWVAMVGLLCIGFIKLGAMRRKPGLLLSHLGCLLVLLGALWGSDTAHGLRAEFLGSQKIASGYMQIHEGHQQEHVISSDGGAILGMLPFSVALSDFWIEYYDAGGTLHVGVTDRDPVALDATVGSRISLDGDLPALEITRVFRNFRIHIEDGARTVSDEPGDGRNPALEIELTFPDGSKSEHYVFAGAMAGHGFSYEGLDLVYRQAAVGGVVKDYKSSLSVLEGEEVMKSQTIEVNKPLSYGGYSFYQSSYDRERGAYTVLSVVSNSGLGMVYAGYILLCAGIVWRFWFRHLAGYLKGRA